MFSKEDLIDYLEDLDWTVADAPIQDWSRFVRNGRPRRWLTASGLLMELEFSVLTADRLNHELRLLNRRRKYHGLRPIVTGL